MSAQSQHVVPHPDGGWAVRKGGSLRATRIFDSQYGAVRYARRLSRSLGAELYIHKRDGTIQTKDSYGNDASQAQDSQ